MATPIGSVCLSPPPTPSDPSYVRLGPDQPGSSHLQIFNNPSNLTTEARYTFIYNSIPRLATLPEACLYTTAEDSTLVNALIDEILERRSEVAHAYQQYETLFRKSMEQRQQHSHAEDTIAQLQAELEAMSVQLEVWRLKCAEVERRWGMLKDQVFRAVDTAVGDDEEYAAYGEEESAAIGDEHSLYGEAEEMVPPEFDVDAVE